MEAFRCGARANQTGHRGEGEDPEAGSHFRRHVDAAPISFPGRLSVSQADHREDDEDWRLSPKSCGKLDYIKSRTFFARRAMNRILLLMDQKENRRLLADLLDDRYEISLAEGDDALSEDFDLAIIDGLAMERLWERVRARKEEEEPVLLPFLVTTSRHDAGLVTRRLWESVDELIQMPVDRLDLLARIEILLRARSFSSEPARSYHALARNIPAAVIVIQDRKIIYANSSAARMNEEEPDPGHSFLELFHPDNHDLLNFHYGEVIEGRTSQAVFEANFIAGGEARQGEFRLVPIMHRRRRAVLEIVQDITKRKKEEEVRQAAFAELEKMVEERTAELQRANEALKLEIMKKGIAYQELEESEIRYRDLAESIPDPFLSWDKNLRLVYCNSSYEKLAGQPSEKMMGKTWFELYPGAAGLPGKERIFREVLATGKPCAFSGEYDRAGVRRTLEINVFPSRTGISVLFRDITDRLEMEDEIRRKNRELEQFAHTVSHDLKNGLLAVRRLLELGRIDIKAFMGKSQLMMDSVDSLMDYLDRLLELAKAGKIIESKEELSIPSIACEIFERLRPPGVEAVISCQEHFPSILGDMSGLQTIFMNLIINSIQYRDVQKERLAIDMGWLLIGDTIVVSYRDNGMGIREGEEHRIFEFGSTSDRKKHAGLGLAMVKRIVEAHGGRILAHSQGQGKGVEFLITLQMS